MNFQADRILPFLERIIGEPISRSRVDDELLRHLHVSQKDRLLRELVVQDAILRFTEQSPIGLNLVTAFADLFSHSRRPPNRLRFYPVPLAS